MPSVKLPYLRRARRNQKTRRKLIFNKENIKQLLSLIKVDHKSINISNMIIILNDFYYTIFIQDQGRTNPITAKKLKRTLERIRADIEKGKLSSSDIDYANNVGSQIRLGYEYSDLPDAKENLKTYQALTYNPDFNLARGEEFLDKIFLEPVHNLLRI